MELELLDIKTIKVFLEAVDRAENDPKDIFLKTITLWDDDLTSLKDILLELLKRKNAKRLST